MTVSFCITCKNRFHQISKTLPKNLRDNRADKNDVEFILVDFNSNDGLHDWIVSKFKKELESGYFKYFTTDQLEHWDCSVAKNTAHLLASGNIVVNLDCDNFTGKRGGKYVIEQFKTYGNNILLHQSSSIPSDGSFGRIGMLKEYFQLIGGYNESFNPMGYQDTDLIQRLIRFGLVYTPKCDTKFNEAIPNTKAESILFTNSLKSYVDMSLENSELSEKNIVAGKLLANENIEWGIRTNLKKIYALSF